MDIATIIQSKDFTLLDVREPMELMLDGKIDTALHIPINEIPERWEELKDQHGTLIVFCRAGARAQKVIDFLSDKGISNTFNGMGYEDLKHYFE